jgi:hypothetical protein
MSRKKDTGVYSQSTQTKHSFNFRQPTNDYFYEIHRRLEELSGGDNWTKTEVINFAIGFTAKSLEAINKQTLRDDM